MQLPIASRGLIQGALVSSNTALVEGEHALFQHGDDGWLYEYELEPFEAEADGLEMREGQVAHHDRGGFHVVRHMGELRKVVLACPVRIKSVRAVRASLGGLAFSFDALWGPEAICGPG